MIERIGPVCVFFACLFMNTALYPTQSDLQVTGELTQGYKHEKAHYKDHEKFSIRDAHIYQTRIAMKLAMEDYFVRAQAGYGTLLQGKMKGLTFTPNYLHMRNGNTFDANIAFGHNFHCSSQSTLSPMVGYAWDAQHFDLKKKNGFTTNFRSRWHAPYIGIRGSLDVLQHVSVYGEYDFLVAVDYHAKLHHTHKAFGKENYTLQSQKRKSFGHVGTLGAGYKVLDNCFIKLEYQIQKIRAYGPEKYGQSRRIFDTSHEGRIGVDYQF